MSRTGTINLALRPDVYCIIFQSLELLYDLSRLKVYASSMPWMLDLLSADSGTEDQFYAMDETRVEQI